MFKTPKLPEQISLPQEAELSLHKLNPTHAGQMREMTREVAEADFFSSGVGYVDPNLYSDRDFYKSFFAQGGNYNHTQTYGVFSGPELVGLRWLMKGWRAWETGCLVRERGHHFSARSHVLMQSVLASDRQYLQSSVRAWNTPSLLAMADANAVAADVEIENGVAPRVEFRAGKIAWRENLSGILACGSVLGMLEQNKADRRARLVNRLAILGITERDLSGGFRI
jgi:hypothetical protein